MTRIVKIATALQVSLAVLATDSWSKGRWVEAEFSENGAKR